VTTTGQAPPEPRSAPAPARPRLVLPSSPGDAEKYGYLDRNLPYLTTILAISGTCLIVSQLRFELQEPALWPFMIFTVSYALYQVVCLPVNFSGRGFDMAAHRALVETWSPAAYPGVDVFLPICGEPVEMLRNTWTAVCALLAAYPGPIQAYVLDDGPSDEAQDLAASLGLAYIRRPGHRVHKKSGNLRYAFAQTASEFILILDADFVPRADLLAETLPYMDDPDLAIVQTPQFFRESPDQSWLENAAGSVQEVFYRAIQVGRDRFGAAACVGTSAVYRRTALEAQGGAALIPYAEDVHTGLNVMRDGWSIRYVPIVLSTGICPNRMDAFVRQQYRWCAGNVGIVCSRRLWTVRMSLGARLTFVSGFFYYVYTALLVFFGPLLPVIMLTFLPGQIRLRNFVILLPAFVTGAVLYPLWHHARYGPSTWPLGIARGWAHVFSLWDGARGRQMSWHPTREPGSSLPRFRIGVTWWSGGMAAAWVLLAIWRIATGSWQSAVLLFFGLLNLAVVSRVIFPGEPAA
jgi:cellulose synthase (UDP-forming)